MKVNGAAPIEHGAIEGALALGVWGTPRATYDVDFLVLAQCTDPQPFLDLLRTAGFAVNESWHEANPMAREVVLRLTHPIAPHFPVDLVFSPGSDDTIWSLRERQGAMGQLHHRKVVVLNIIGLGHDTN